MSNNEYNKTLICVCVLIDNEDLREHGMLSHRHNVVVVIDHDNIMQIRENANNCDILDLLSDSHRLLKQKYLFMVGNWLDVSQVFIIKQTLCTVRFSKL